MPIIKLAKGGNPDIVLPADPEWIGKELDFMLLNTIVQDLFAKGLLEYGDRVTGQLWRKWGEPAGVIREDDEIFLVVGMKLPYA